jgi:DNA-binding Lrp family transcriptional regulator
MRLDEIDLNILRILQQNGRITNVQLSSEIGLSPAPTLERVRKLESQGIIQSYHAMLNAQKMGLNVVVFIEVSLNLHRESPIEHFMEAIRNMPEVVECFHITGDADFLLKIYAADIDAYQKLIIEKIAKLPEVGKVLSKVVLSTVKRSMELPLPAPHAPLKV